MILSAALKDSGQLVSERSSDAMGNNPGDVQREGLCGKAL